MQKVLLVCHQFFPRFFTGTEMLVLEVADELVRRGSQVEILTAEPGDNTDIPALSEESFGGHKVWRVLVPRSSNPVQRLKCEIDRPELAELFQRVIDAARPQIAHIFHLMRLTTSLVEVLKLNQIRVIFTATDYWWVCPAFQLMKWNGSICAGQDKYACISCLVDTHIRRLPRAPLHLKAGRFMPAFAALVSTKARACVELMETRIERHKRMATLCEVAFFPNPFIENVFRNNDIVFKKTIIQPFPLPRRANGVRSLPPVAQEGRLKLAFIGTLRPSKGPQVLLEACRLLDDRNDLEVQIWGASTTPEFENELRLLAGERQWIKFCGTFKPDSFVEVLQKIDVVVVPSLWYENTPLTALTASAGRRIILVSDVPGLACLITEQNSDLLFPAGDAVALAARIRNIAERRDLSAEFVQKVLMPPDIENYVERILGEYRKS